MTVSKVLPALGKSVRFAKESLSPQYFLEGMVGDVNVSEGNPTFSFRIRQRRIEVRLWILTH